MPRVGSLIIVTFQVELVSPESISYSGEAEMVIARTVEGGDIAFQPGHVPFIGVLSVWSVEVIRPDGERDVFAVHRGFVQVAGTKVSILSDVSEVADEIDIERAKEARLSAQEAIQSNSEDQEAIASLERSEVRLRVGGVEV
ncbi:MAG: ATP synthase F1 subunit epsilon [Actinobacteria bacterium]|nr:ATP synthase F1 subunit epsilon [Actinomycetota bacterium]